MIENTSTRQFSTAAQQHLIEQTRQPSALHAIESIAGGSQSCSFATVASSLASVLPSSVRRTNNPAHWFEFTASPAEHSLAVTPETLSGLNTPCHSRSNSLSPSGLSPLPNHTLDFGLQTNIKKTNGVRQTTAIQDAHAFNPTKAVLKLNHMVNALQNIDIDQVDDTTLQSMLKQLNDAALQAGLQKGALIALKMRSLGSTFLRVSEHTKNNLHFSNPKQTLFCL